MKCKYCNAALQDGAKFCNNCGKPVSSTVEKSTNIDVEKLKKRISNTGNSLFLIGWLTIAINVGVYFWSLVDISFAQSGLPANNLPTMLLMVNVGIVFVVLGSRIKTLIDKDIKAYLQILIALSVLLFCWVVLSGGSIGLMFILIIVYLFSSLVAINKLMQVNEFTSTLTNPKYQLDNGGWIIFAIYSIVLVLFAYNFDSIFKGVISSNAPTVTNEVTQDVNSSPVKQTESPTSENANPVTTNTEPKTVSNSFDCKNTADQAAVRQQAKQGNPTTVLQNHFNKVLNKCFYELKIAMSADSVEVDIRSAPSDDWIAQCLIQYPSSQSFCTQHNVGQITELQFRQFENQYFNN